MIKIKFMVLQGVILTLLVVACTSTYEVKQLMDPHTGKVGPVTVKNSKILGIPAGSDAQYPERSDSQKQRTRVGNWGGYLIIGGVILLVVGVGVHISVSIKGLQRMSEAVAFCGAGGIVGGFFLVGLAVAWYIALLAVCFGILGYLMYILRNKGLKWPSRK